MSKRYKVGDRVSIQRSDVIDWTDAIDDFVGKKATITRVSNDHKYPYLLDIDGGEFIWSHDDLILVAFGPPPVCRKCRETFQYANPNPDFVCYSCSH